MTTQSNETGTNHASAESAHSGDLFESASLFLCEKAPTVFAILSIATFASGCKPPKVKDYKEIGPSETAWVIPMDQQGTNTASGDRFDSVSFLDARKIATKRVEIDKVERKVGRFPWSVEWMDKDKLITVDRQMVTREWTDSTEKGTSKAKEGLNIMTKDSIPLTAGLTVTASIEEPDASLYLYHHGLKKLSEVLDTNIRSFAQSELGKAYGKLDLSQAQQQTPEIYTALFEKAKTEFKLKGVTIHYLGNADGIRPDDPKIQSAINEKYLAEQSIKTASQRREAQEQENKMTVAQAASQNTIKLASAEAENQMKLKAADTENQIKLLAAKSEADAIRLTAEARQKAAEIVSQKPEALRLFTDLDVELLRAKAGLEMAKKWNGDLPANIMPASSPIFTTLGLTTSTNK